MRLYYFTGPGFAVDNVARRQLKVSFPNEVNDIFEMMPFDFGDNRQLRKNWRKSIVEHSQECGFISFSENWSVPTMWGHYAQSHQGVCYGFDVEGKVLKMNYEDSFCEFDSTIKPSTEEQYWQFRYAQETKSSHWKYENEWRLFLKLNEKERALKKRGVGTFFKSFGSDLILKEIIIGAKCTLKKDDFEKALVGYSDCQILKARPSFRDFTIVEHQNFFK